MAKQYGGWAAYGRPKFDDSSVSGGKPVHNGTTEGRTQAARAQKGYNKISNCRKCDPDHGVICGKHAKNI